MPLIILTRRKFEAEMSKHAAAACERLIAAIGAELHDDLIQQLTSFRLHMIRALRSSSDRSLMIWMRAELEVLMSAVRRISRRMLLVRMEGDTLITLLKRLCHTLDGLSLRVDFTTEGDPVPIAQHVEMHIVRIVELLVQSAFRRSCASHTCVRLCWRSGMLFIEVEDNGIGFNRIPEFVSRLKSKNSMLKIRSKAIGASIRYAPGKAGLLARVKLRVV